MIKKKLSPRKSSEQIAFIIGIKLNCAWENIYTQIYFENWPIYSTQSELEIWKPLYVVYGGGGNS